jgi:hypothetical protein
MQNSKRAADGDIRIISFDSGYQDQVTALFIDGLAK